MFTNTCEQLLANAGHHTIEGFAGEAGETTAGSGELGLGSPKCKTFDVKWLLNSRRMKGFGGGADKATARGRELGE